MYLFTTRGAQSGHQVTSKSPPLPPSLLAPLSFFLLLPHRPLHSPSLAILFWLTRRKEQVLNELFIFVEEITLDI